MPVLYVQESKEASRPGRTEVHVESVEDLAVKDFKDTLLEKFDVPLEEQCQYIYYGGGLHLRF